MRRMMNERAQNWATWIAIPQCQADDHLRDCIAHLNWHGEAACHETEDGYLVVQFGDFPIDA